MDRRSTHGRSLDKSPRPEQWLRRPRVGSNSQYANQAGPYFANCGAATPKRASEHRALASSRRTNHRRFCPLVRAGAARRKFGTAFAVAFLEVGKPVREVVTDIAKPRARSRAGRSLAFQRAMVAIERHGRDPSVVVPSTPSDVMLAAGLRAGHMDADTLARIYRAMVHAAAC